MKDKRLLLIVNPRSGRVKIKSELLNIIQTFSDEGYDVLVHTTKARNDATEYVSTLTKNDLDLMVVCGGDGTLNEVITGMRIAKLDCPIGYIPAGTLNEWSSSLNISRNFVQAAKDIISGTEITLDIGQFGDKYFSYTASFGAFTSASYTAPQDVKNALGQAAYLLEGIKALGNIKPIHLCFEADGQTIEGDFLFGAVSNSMSVGGVVKFNEALVNLNDGLFEVMLIRNPENIMQFQGIVDGILRQELTRSGIEFFHTNEIKIIGGENVDWTLDGEYSAGKDEVVVKNLPSALRLIVPSQTKDKGV